MQTYQQALPSGRWLWIRWHALIQQRHNFLRRLQLCNLPNLIRNWEPSGLDDGKPGDDGCGTGRHSSNRALIERLRLLPAKTGW